MKIERQREKEFRERKWRAVPRIQILGPTVLGIFGTLKAFRYLKIWDLLIDLVMGNGFSNKCGWSVGVLDKEHLAIY